MNSFVSQPRDRLPSSMLRWGLGLAAIAISYIAAVIAFIVIY